MISNIKKAIDNFFDTGWTLTPIQFEATDFDFPADKKWISLAYLPYDRDVYGMDGDTGRKRTYTVVVVRCFSTTSTLAYDLANEVQTFFECQQIDEIKINVGIGDGNGVVDNGNGTYQVTLNFDTINYE